MSDIDKESVKQNGEITSEQSSEHNCEVCVNKTSDSETCAGCKNVKLCRLCLQRHRFQNRCLAWKAGHRRQVGNCLLASRDISPLEVVLVDSAVVVVPALKLTCLGCGRYVNCRYKCGDCRLPLCGTECPLKARHLSECGDLARLGLDDLSEDSTDLTTYSIVAVLRLIRLETSSPALWRQIKSLESHYQKFEHIKSLDAVIDSLSKLGFQRQTIISAYGIIIINSYPISELEGGFTRGIFPVQSLLNHSCTPNLQYIQKEGDSRIVLQSVRNIEAGEILSVRYVPFLQGRISIARKLRETWFFQCTCPRCKDGTEMGTFTSSALCENKACNKQGAILLMVDGTNENSNWICPSCQTIRSESYVEELERTYIEKFKSLPQCDMRAFYEFLNELGERFHASHHLVMRMAKFLVLIQGKKLESLPREQIDTQSVLCDKLLVYVSRLDPGATQTRAKLLLEKNKAFLNQAKRDCENGKISRKQFMAAIKEGVKAEVNAKKILFYKWDEQRA